MTIRIIRGIPNVKLGARVREIDGRHEGTVRSIQWSQVRVVWDDNGFISDCYADELEIVID